MKTRSIGLALYSEHVIPIESGPSQFPMSTESSAPTACSAAANSSMKSVLRGSDAPTSIYARRHTCITLSANVLSTCSINPELD